MFSFLIEFMMLFIGVVFVGFIQCIKKPTRQSAGADHKKNRKSKMASKNVSTKDSKKTSTKTASKKKKQIVSNPEQKKKQMSKPDTKQKSIPNKKLKDVREPTPAKKPDAKKDESPIAKSSPVPKTYGPPLGLTQDLPPESYGTPPKALAVSPERACFNIAGSQHLQKFYSRDDRHAIALLLKFSHPDQYTTAAIPLLIARTSGAHVLITRKAGKINQEESIVVFYKFVSHKITDEKTPWMGKDGKLLMESKEDKFFFIPVDQV